MTSKGLDLMEQLRDEPILYGIIETVKSSLSWNASSIRITINKEELEILDNGCGLVGSNKKDILRLGDFPGKHRDSRKSTKGRGHKGTGIKALYINSRKIELLSSVEDELPKGGAVYSLQFSSAEFFASLKYGAKPLAYKVEPLTAQSWPYVDEFRIGLRLRVRLKNEILHPERLSRTLTALLPSQYRDLGIILVNGERLPMRKLIGDSFNYHGYHEVLGHMRVELCNIHPDDRVSEDGLRVGGREIAEISFKFFLGALDDEVFNLIPHCFRDTKKICGSIIVPFLEDYTSPDREMFFSERKLPDGKIMRLSDDPRVIAFISWLRHMEPVIREELEIE